MSWEPCNNPLYSDIEGVAAIPNIITNTVDSGPKIINGIEYNTRPVVYKNTASGIIVGIEYHPLHHRDGFISDSYVGSIQEAIVNPQNFGPTAKDYKQWKEEKGYHTH